ncbi:MAG: dienelactone hydrolase family protein [Marmoricola sp.]|nr:dienelactone hydrolase family protein [Marmoricola sp.]
MIEIAAPDGDVEAWLSRPDDAADHPGVLLLIDAIGLRPEIERIADRIAAWGYVVLAPNLFYRTGTAAELAPTGDLTQPGERDAFFATVGPRMGGLTTENAERDIAAYLSALIGLDGVRPGSLGVTGYCLGARLAVRAAAIDPEHVAAVGGFHGGNIVTDAEDSPHLGLQRARAAFVFGHADNDGSMSPEAVAALGEALTAAGLEHTNEIFPGSPHGYVMSDTSMYDRTGAERQFAELQELFARTL